MLKHLLLSLTMAGVLAVGVPATEAFAQQTTASEDAKKAGKETKKAGKHAGEATKEAAKATGKGVKHGAKKAGNAVKDGVTLDTTSALCKDGTTQTGKTKTTACNGHGGVAAK
jgi:hypothetical protein